MKTDEAYLERRHRAILDMTFGLHGQRQHTLLGIAEEFGVPTERIRVIRRQALRRLETIGRERLAGRTLPGDMLVDHLAYDIVVSAMQDLMIQLPGTTQHVPLPKLKELVRQRLQQLKEEMAKTPKRKDNTEHLTRMDYEYDVALSFAGTERHLAKYVAKVLRQIGFRVFYDDFYARELWGKELTVSFDEIYRKQSHYCVVFASPAYVERMWTNYERRSALARALQEKGDEYILPVEVEPAELPGIPPTVGYLSLSKFTIEEVTRMLIDKLEETSPHRCEDELEMAGEH